VFWRKKQPRYTARNCTGNPTDLQNNSIRKENPRMYDELDSFQNLWKGGYFEGDPLDPLGMSGYGFSLNYLSVLYVTYCRCIEPYINSTTIAIEIGPGRGAWTKTMLAAKEVWTLDALSAEHNGFFEYLRFPGNVNYFQVSDFSCSMLPCNYFDYMFSFGCLCHVSFRGITEYAHNIFPKLKSGCNCFWMVADYRKYNEAVKKIRERNIWENLVPAGRRYLPIKYLLKVLERTVEKPNYKREDENDNPLPGRWYDAGIDRTCAMLEKVGYEVVNPDIGTLLRDPIVHFRKA
jgi:hypothetical protein